MADTEMKQAQAVEQASILYLGTILRYKPPS